jgi:multidrug efflux pump subunit AcrA (membrane-fusion protein)
MESQSRIPVRIEHGRSARLWRLLPLCFQAILLVASVITLSACSKTESAPSAPPPMGVKVETTTTTTITDASNYTGAIVSRHSITLMPKIDGHITKILCKSGDRVKPGEALLVINPDQQTASVQSYVAAHESNKDDLETARHSLNSLEAMKQARLSAVKLADADRQRYVTLRAAGAVSQQELDQRLNTLEAAKADLASIEAQIAGQQAVVKRSGNVLLQSKANVDSQNAQLQYFTIKAPFAGIVGDIPVKLGDYVNTNSRLTTVTENQPLEVYVSIPVEHAKQLKINMPIELLDSKGDLIGVSHVFFVAPNVAPDSQTVLVKASFSNSKDELRADQSVNARVIWQKRPGVLIPTEAVSHQSGQDFVFVAKTAAGRTVAKQLAVHLGAIEGTRYQVITGLNAGEKIVTSGIQNLADGVPINPTM